MLSCGGDAGGQPELEPEPEPEPAAEPEPASEIDPKAIWNLKCAPCHGSDFRGGAGGIDLTRRLPMLSDEQAKDSIENGVPPSMPAWSDSLTEEEVEAVIAYLRSQIE